MNMADAVRPLFLVKPKSMSRRDINRAEKMSGICIVECAEPDTARYSEPPLDAQIDLQARAALSLMRIIMRSNNTTFYRQDITKWFIDAILGESVMLVERVPVLKTTKKTT